VFVLDNQRLRPYTDERTQFDNRYMARMPTAEQLRKLGLQHVLYVVPGGSTPPQELDDLNEDFVAWRAGELDVKLVAASDFQPDPTENTPSAMAATGQPSADGGTPAAATDAGTLDAGTTDAGTSGLATASTASVPAPRAWYFGGARAAHETFWLFYPWGRTQTVHETVRGISPAGILSTKELARVPTTLSGGYAYEPSRRTTMFSSVPRGASGAPRPPPSGFGKVAMRVSSKSRSILGPAFTSRSSWNRSSSYSSSGG
jgi:hypothetical protein